MENSTINSLRSAMKRIVELEIELVMEKTNILELELKAKKPREAVEKLR